MRRVKFLVGDYDDPMLPYLRGEASKHEEFKPTTIIVKERAAIAKAEGR